MTLTYFRMIFRLMAFFEAKNCILFYTEIISETSNTKEDCILYNQKYMDHVLHVHSFIVKSGQHVHSDVHTLCYELWILELCLYSNDW